MLQTLKKNSEEQAHTWVKTPLYDFSEAEKKLLRNFFTNTERRAYLMHSLPVAMGTVLLAMFSRIKNPRGLRGVFVDSFIPELLASRLPETEERFEGDGAKFLKHHGVVSLEDFIAHSQETGREYRAFREAISIDPEYLEGITRAEKIIKFLKRWLDAYGHNSIARMGSVWICCEQISILAAKSLEWTRPSAGYIELSTRYVDMSGKACYPIAAEIAEYGVDQKEVEKVIAGSFDHYRELQGENFTGPFPARLRERFGSLYVGNEKDLESGVIGETCDVLGNFLPAATLTSVGINVSGESLPSLIQHLILDNTAETTALAHEIMEEAKKIGDDQFVRHIEPTEWKKAEWEYLSCARFAGENEPCIIDINAVDATAAAVIMGGAFRYKASFSDCYIFEDVVKRLQKIPRGEYDKLPGEFETVSALFSGVMSFRGWRDLHRMGYSTHARTYLTPELGFYSYDKEAPTVLRRAFFETHQKNIALYRDMKSRGVPDALAQYPLALGNLVGFTFAGNLRQLEFCNWQRSKFSVNHEVRQIFLGMEQYLRQTYPWWADISRADTTKAYVFARGSKGIPQN